MKAKKLVDLKGSDLIGCIVMTEAIGEYPGGRAKVIEIAPDPGAPEIVCNVKHPTFGQIGVFEFEEMDLLDTSDN
jgi:hypothetical protein